MSKSFEESPSASENAPDVDAESFVPLSIKAAISSGSIQEQQAPVTFSTGIPASGPVDASEGLPQDLFVGDVYDLHNVHQVIGAGEELTGSPIRTNGKSQIPTSGFDGAAFETVATSLLEAIVHESPQVEIDFQHQVDEDSSQHSDVLEQDKEHTIQQVRSSLMESEQARSAQAEDDEQSNSPYASPDSDKIATLTQKQQDFQPDDSILKLEAMLDSALSDHLEELSALPKEPLGKTIDTPKSTEGGHAMSSRERVPQETTTKTEAMFASVLASNTTDLQASTRNDAQEQSHGKESDLVEASAKSALDVTQQNLVAPAKTSGRKQEHELDDSMAKLDAFLDEALGDNGSDATASNSSEDAVAREVVEGPADVVKASKKVSTSPPQAHMKVSVPASGETKRKEKSKKKLLSKISSWAKRDKGLPRGDSSKSHDSHRATMHSTTGRRQGTKPKPTRLFCTGVTEGQSGDSKAFRSLRQKQGIHQKHRSSTSVFERLYKSNLSRMRLAKTGQKIKLASKQKKNIPVQLYPSLKSLASLSSQCTVSQFTSPRRTGKLGCQANYNPRLYDGRAPCELCIYFLSDNEKAQLDATGRHFRVMYTSGGCSDPFCCIFSRVGMGVGEGEDDDDTWNDKALPVRLCPGCFHTSHRRLYQRNVNPRYSQQLRLLSRR